MNEDARPMHERCGLTAAELADWNHISAEVGRQVAVTKARRTRVWVALGWLALAFWAFLIHLLIGVLS